MTIKLSGRLEGGYRLEMVDRRVAINNCNMFINIESTQKQLNVELMFILLGQFIYYV